MGKVKLTRKTRTTYRKSKTTKSGNKRRCKTCGKYI